MPRTAKRVTYKPLSKKKLDSSITAENKRLSDRNSELKEKISSDETKIKENKSIISAIESEMQDIKKSSQRLSR